MKTLIKKLEELDFSDKEARVYLALLELGYASPAQIATKAGIKRTTVYNVLPELLKRGFISKTFVKGKKVFWVEDVRKLKFVIDERQQKFEHLFPQLEALHSVLPSKPKFRYYEGENGMKQLHMYALEKTIPGDTIYEYLGTVDFKRLFPEEFYDFYPKERTRRKISARIIAPDIPETRDIVQKDKRTLRETRLAPRDQLLFSGDMQLYRNHVALISYKENFMGVVIESKEIYEMQKCVFELLWNTLAGPTATP
ncbi:hypothetical protein H6758_03160 [Candidatus Nomurabacteria bacterium]|nr:hypothetical protein [Candidatus Nomurabacteria bacterium]